MAPAVAAVRVRRVELLAPVAARVRRSLAVSLRMRPTVMARMPRARTIPKAVAQLMISDEVGALVLGLDGHAAPRPRSTGAADLGGGERMRALDQPTRRDGLQAELVTACSVITVLGAEVPDGRAPTSWITGLARHELRGQGKSPVPLGRPGTGSDGGRLAAVGELHVGQRRTGQASWSGCRRRGRSPTT